MPATSQLEWLISMTAMIVLFWSRATRDLLKSFGWGITGTPSIRYSDEVAISRRPPHSIYRSPLGKRSVLRAALINRRPLLQRGNPATRSREGPMVRIRLPPAASQQRTVLALGFDGAASRAPSDGVAQGNALGRRVRIAEGCFPRRSVPMTLSC